MGAKRATRAVKTSTDRVRRTGAQARKHAAKVQKAKETRQATAVATLAARVQALEAELTVVRAPRVIELPGTWTPASGPRLVLEKLEDAHVANIVRLAVRRATNARQIELLAIAYEAGKRGLERVNRPIDQLTLDDDRDDRDGDTFWDGP